MYTDPLPVIRMSVFKIRIHKNVEIKFNCIVLVKKSVLTYIL